MKLIEDSAVHSKGQAPGAIQFTFFNAVWKSMNWYLSQITGLLRSSMAIWMPGTWLLQKAVSQGTISISSAIIVLVPNHYSIIDWDTAQVAPAASAIQHPLFIADIPGWRNDGVPEGMTFEDDRAYLEHAIRKLEDNAGPIATMLESSRERQFFELSLCNSRINHEYVEQRLQGCLQKVALLNELENFLSLHESMRSIPKVLSIRAQLTGEENTYAEKKW